MTPPANADEEDCYSPGNVAFPGDGTAHLQVTAVQSTCGGVTYPDTGAMITTNPDDGRASGGFQYTYGVVEALVYIPPSTSSTIANCFHFIYSSSGSEANPGSCVSGNFSGWHTFASDWQPGSVTYYYDGIQVGQITTGITSAPMYLIVDNTIGSDGRPLVTPADLQVSYVKVWQQ